MRYIPHTEDDVRRLLDVAGVGSVAELFEQIPPDLRLNRLLDLPPALSEAELVRHMEELATDTECGGLSFLGAGVYPHHTPAAVDEILRRPEFYTAYTPYQPEVSQGTLQAIFEFQTMVCQLLGMDVSNASMYDGATALAEALLMAQRVTRRSKVFVSQTTHPEYQEVVDGYFRAHQDDVVPIPMKEGGTTDLAALETALDAAGKDVAAVAVQYPNFFGGLEDLTRIAELAHARKALFVVTFTEAVAFGLIKPPGAFGADIVAGEGQSLGNAMSFGGPHLGLFAARDKRTRAMPGRLVGRTVDANGEDGFVLTLSTREQHIRREKATSNICTNEGLCALAATVYMALLGPRGLNKLARLNHANAELLKTKLTAIPGFSLKFPELPTFNEFVLQTPRPAAEIVDKLASAGVVPGLALGRFYPGLDDCLLVTATEMHSLADLDRLTSVLASF